MTIKFLGARQENAERLGIIGVNLFGYEQSEEVALQEKSLGSHSRCVPDDEDAEVPGETILLQSLKFLQVQASLFPYVIYFYSFTSINLSIVLFCFLMKLCLKDKYYILESVGLL